MSSHVRHGFSGRCCYTASGTLCRLPLPLEQPCKPRILQPSQPCNLITLQPYCQSRIWNVVSLLFLSLFCLTGTTLTNVMRHACVRNYFLGPTRVNALLQPAACGAAKFASSVALMRSATRSQLVQQSQNYLLTEFLCNSAVQPGDFATAAS